MFAPRSSSHRSSRRGRFQAMEQLEPRLLLSAADGSDAMEVFHAQDALFAENAGQWSSDEIRFGYSSSGAGIWFTDDSIDFVLTQANGDEVLSDAFSLRFDGAQSATPAGADQAETIFNYHTGSDQTRWVDGVSTFKAVRYEDLYAGVDLHTFSRHGQMKYEFHVAVGGDYQQIQLSYAGIEGLWIADDGSLHIQTELGEIVDEGLFVYQEIDGQRVEVAGAFELIDSDTYTFAVTGDYDPTVELVIDPALSWSTYIGGTGDDNGFSVAVDSTGAVVVTGTALSSGWPGGGAGGFDAFVTKLTPAGGHTWSTFVGGALTDEARGVAVDSSDAIYLVGDSLSAGWASGGYDTTHNGFDDVFVAKLSSAGGHVWSTYMGGNKWDNGYGIAVSGGGVYVTGYTQSTTSWVSGGFDTSYNGGLNDAFVARLAAVDGDHVWSTFMGGGGADSGLGIAVNGAVYVTGATESSGWTSGGADTTYGGSGDGWAARLTAGGGDHVWSTYIGTGGADSGRGIAVDGYGGVYVTGASGAGGWALGGYDGTHNGGNDAFVVKFMSTAKRPTVMKNPRKTHAPKEAADNKAPAGGRGASEARNPSKNRERVNG